MPSLHRAVPVRFFQIVPAKPSLRSSFMSGRLCCLATESNSCSSSATSASAISVFTRLSDKFVKLVLQTTLPVLPAITRQPWFLWFVVKDSCVEKLFVCTSASSLIMMSSHWCAPPSRSRKTLALWLPSSSGPLSEAALLLEICSLLQPAQFFVKKRSSEKSEVLVTVSVLDATTLPVDTPPLVAVKVQSRLSQSSGPVEAAPLIVSVDTSPTVVKFSALAVLLMVRVLPVIPVAELSRPTLAAPVMLSELLTRRLWTTAWLHASCEHVRAVHVVAQQLVAARVALRGESVQRRSVTETDSPSKALALICMLYRSSAPADWGIDPPAEEGAGDAHVVVVGSADVHQVGGRAQPVPAAKGVASPRHQGVGADDVPDEGARGPGVKNFLMW